jgi:hypothetical protein
MKKQRFLAKKVTLKIMNRLKGTAIVLSLYLSTNLTLAEAISLDQL